MVPDSVRGGEQGIVTDVLDSLHNLPTGHDVIDGYVLSKNVAAAVKEDAMVTGNVKGLAVRELEGDVVNKRGVGSLVEEAGNAWPRAVGDSDEGVELEVE